MSAAEPRVIILILSWNGRGDLLECLESVARTDYGNFETVVIDNASTDGTADAVRKRFPGVALVVNDRNLGYAGGNNAGMKACADRGADYFLILNNDCVVDRGYLRELVAVAERYPRGGYFGPKTYQYGSDRILDFAGGRFDWRTGRTQSIGVGETDKGQYEEVREYDFMNGHALLVRRAVVEAIGLLDEEYFGYNEETDWCLRARRAGFASVYVPRAVVRHKVSRTACGLLRPYLIARNQILFMRKHASRAQFARFLANYLCVQFPRRMASCVKHGNRAELAVVVKAVGWHLGLWRRHNPLTAMRGIEKG